MSDILIIANFCRDFTISDNGRFLYLSKILSMEGHDVEIVTSDFSHSRKEHKQPLEVEWPFKITFLHEPGYRRNVSLRRLTSHFAWGRKVAKYLSSRKKPDVVYSAVPSLTAARAAAMWCERNNVKYVIDIQDLWPEAFQLALNMPMLSDIVFYPLGKMADDVYSRADEVCAVSQTYVDRAMRVNRKCQEPTVVFLGTSLETFDSNAATNRVDKPTDEIWIGYCGTLGASYDLTVVIEALCILKQRGVKPPKLIVMGDGERRDEFEQLAKSHQVDSIFKGRLPYDQMCGWLSACDIAVNPIVHGAAQSIINKHADYAAAGIPVISTQESEEYRILVDQNKMGFNCENSNAEELADMIWLLIKDSSKRLFMGANARKCAVKYFDRRNTYQLLAKKILCNESTV